MIEKKISVVIPVYNAQDTLRECLSSLFDNNYKTFEVIIVNDCSSDRSVDIAKGYPCKIINLPERRGPAFARDRSLPSATGEIIAFLDSDCIVPDDWLTKINLKLTKDLSGIGGKYNLPKETNDIHSLFMTYWDPKNAIYTRSMNLISLSGGNCAFWKSALTRKRGKKELVYCNGRVGGDDTIMCHEIGKFGRLIYDPDLFVTHNKSGTLLNILRETITLGYSGATVAAACGGSLIKEPHRFYKSILYLSSLALFFSALLLPFTKAWIVYLLIFYLAIQLPIIFLTAKRLSRPLSALSLPPVIFASDLLYFIGHIKKGWDIIQKAVVSFIWHMKLLSNIINPYAVSRIFFFVTKKCNAICYFCFNKQGRQADQEEDLSLEEIGNITSKIGFLSWLTITGGEPFLRNDIYEICKSFYSNCDTRVISIATNGTLTSHIEDTAERLLIDCNRLYLTIIIALDDIGEKHDRIKGIKGCYGQALHTLKKLHAMQTRFPRLTLGINTTIIGENAGRIEEILDYFRNNLDYDRQCLNLLRQLPCTNTGPELISIQKYFSLMKTKTFRVKPAAPANLLKQKFNQAALEYLCDKSLEEFKEGRAIDRCLAAQKFFVINYNARVYACELLQEEIGNLRAENYDLNKIKNNSKCKEMKTKIKNTKCYCQWACAVASKNYLNIFWYPSIIKGIIQK